jgi:divalent metal cation (Fe/Co/Zn/Cd) transporter
MREPTKEERAKEVSFFYTNLADTGMVALLIVTAITSGSLTMLGEAVRGVLLLSIQFYSIWLLYAVHRDRLTRYEYGVGKMEQFVWVVIGIGMLFGGFWVAQTVVETILSAEPAASPLGLAMAAIVNAINLVINAIGLFAMYAASRDRESGIFGAQIRARVGMLLVTLILQVTITAAALAKDPGIALVMDATGACLIVYFKLRRGFKMIAHGLPDLLDAPAKRELGALIRRTAAAILPEEHIVSIRTRRSGSRTFAEVAVAGSAFPSMQALRSQTAAIRQALRREDAEIDLEVVVASKEASGPSGSSVEAPEAGASQPPEGGDEAGVEPTDETKG